MRKQFYKDAFGWGFLLWLVGYVLGIMLFTAVPQNLLGWFIMPIGTIVTLWVLVAVIFDYFFLVKVLKPADGYYKLDVYLYYALTFILPLIYEFRTSLFSVSSALGGSRNWIPAFAGMTVVFCVFRRPNYESAKLVLLLVGEKNRL